MIRPILKQMSSWTVNTPWWNLPGNTSGSVVAGKGLDNYTQATQDLVQKEVIYSCSYLFIYLLTLLARNPGKIKVAETLQK